MAMFQKAPDKLLAADLAAKIVERDRLIARLADAVAAVSSATSAATALAVNGATDAVLDGAEAKVRALSDRVTTLKAALVKVEATVVTLEGEYAAHLDQKTRRETGIQCEAMAERVEKIGLAMAPLMKELADVTGRAGAAEIWDARGLNTFAQNCVLQIPEGVALVAASIREHAGRVMAGMARATLLAPAVPAKTVAVAEPKVVRVFTLQNIKWTADDCRLMTISKFVDCDLPVETAKRALASRACAPMDSDVRRQWAGNRPVTHPFPDQCVSVDGADVVKIDAPIDATFTRIDRGAPFEATILRKA